MPLHQIVLVIDDDRVFASVVAKMLTQRRFLPVLTVSVENALNLSERSDFSFVLTDISLPGLGGIEGIKVLRERYGEIKIIAMSDGWGEQSGKDSLVAARKIGANWALKKPFTADELNEAIAGVLKGQTQEEIIIEPEPLSNPYVAVVDDDPEVGKVISKMLDRIVSGKVELMDQAEKVLAALKNPVRPDLIITDLNMPGMDGLALLRYLVEAEYTGSVCFISGEDKSILRSAERLAKSHKLSVVGALQKPVTLDDMTLVISELEASQKQETVEQASPITEKELRRAIKEGHLEVHYQPKVSTKTKDLIGVEALIRWHHSDLGLLYPGLFIPVAEKYGLIDLLTDAVILATMEAQGTWRRQGMDIKVSINLSTSCLGRLDFPEFLAAQVDYYGSSPELVIIEITEGGLADDVTRALEIMSRLRLKGFGLSIDDFGTGYSSLSLLEEAPFNELKIDRSFVAGAASDHSKRAILETSVEMARKLDVSTVAEGVETQEDWDLVAELGVDLVQGYFIAKPMPEVEFMDWVKQWKTKCGAGIDDEHEHS